MAHLCRRDRSPFWWVKYRDCKPGSPTLGQTIRTSTRFRIGIGPDMRKASQLCAELTLAEKKCKPQSAACPSRPPRLFRMPRFFTASGGQPR